MLVMIAFRPLLKTTLVFIIDPFLIRHNSSLSTFLEDKFENMDSYHLTRALC